MRKMGNSLIAALCTTALLAACTEQQPAAPDSEVVPNLGATVSNEIVFQHPLRLTWLDNDPSEPWDVVLIGYDPADDSDCNGGVFVGGIPTRTHVAVSQEGFPWGQRDQQLVTTIGRPPLYLYTRASVPFGGTADDFCDWLKNDWIAAGSWSAVLAGDNDVSGDDGTPGVNSWGGTETGRLVGTDGTRYKYSWKYRLMWEPERGFFKVAHEVDGVERK